MYLVYELINFYYPCRISSNEAIAHWRIAARDFMELAVVAMNIGT